MNEPVLDKEAAVRRQMAAVTRASLGWLRRRVVECLVFLWVLLVFGVLGPITGGIVFFLWFSVVLVAKSGLSLGGLSWAPFLLGMMIWYSFPIGLLSALLTGFVVAVKKIWLGGAGRPYAAIAGGLAANLESLAQLGSGFSPGLVALRALIGVVASLVCWRVVGGRPIVHP